MSKLAQAQRGHIPESRYAFPNAQKEPLNDAAHVRNAIARFDQVKDVTDTERDEAWKRIQSAAKTFGVEMNEQSWRELPHHGKI
jgi:cell division protein FtsX